MKFEPALWLCTPLEPPLRLCARSSMAWHGETQADKMIDMFSDFAGLTFVCSLDNIVYMVGTVAACH